MAGPVSMTLGPFAFETFGFAYQDVRRNLETRWESVPVAGGLDALQWLGPTADDVTIKGCLFPERYGGDLTLEALRQAALSGRVLILASLQGRIFGPHVVQSISEEREFMTALGRPRKLSYRLSLTRYASRRRAG